MRKLIIHFGGLIMLISIISLIVYGLDYIQVIDTSLLWDNIPEEIVLPSLGSVSIITFILRIAWILFKAVLDGNSAELQKEIDKLNIKAQENEIVFNKVLQILEVQAKATIESPFSTQTQTEELNKILGNVKEVIEEVIINEFEGVL